MNDLRKMKLVKSRTNKMLTGVCGGIGELLGIDPTIIRLIWAALSLAGGTGIILYIIAAVIIPEDDDIIDAEERAKLSKLKRDEPISSFKTGTFALPIIGSGT